jgi:two-component sensor histidine kinase
VPILLSSYKIDKTKIKVTLEISDISFNITTAIPLAQLINELFTNSLKHAFPLDRSGEIHITLFYSTAINNTCLASVIMVLVSPMKFHSLIKAILVFNLLMPL